MDTLLHNQYPAVAHILIHAVNLAFGPKSGFRNKCWAQAWFGLQNETSYTLAPKIRPVRCWPDP